MIEGIAHDAIAQIIISEKEMLAGIQGLKTTAEEGGTICNTFFKAVGSKTHNETFNGSN